MKVSERHRSHVENNVGRNTEVLRKELMRMNLTKTQANNCIKNVRKRLKVYNKR